MLATTHTIAAPWTVIKTDRKKVARLNVIRLVLRGLGARAPAPDRAVCIPGDKAAGRLNA
jgi:hypothetical protein